MEGLHVEPNRSRSAEIVSESLLADLEARGYRGRIVWIERQRELEAEVDSRHSEGQFDEAFYKERLARLSFDPPADFTGARSIIVVALPRPQTQAVFNRHGRRLPLILPPTYTGYSATDEYVVSLLGELLAPYGCRTVAARLPLKLLATRSGLGTYGRNNICYVPGMGSFLQLAAAYSDLTCSQDTWQEARMLERCRTCKACLRRCPTGAIPTDGFLIRAERCLVFHNERRAEIPFPGWIDPSWHNCLEGCMLCQWACPEDKPFRNWIEGTEEFSEEETSVLLNRASPDQLSPDTAAKLERLGLLGDVELLARNLGVFFDAGSLPSRD